MHFLDSQLGGIRESFVKNRHMIGKAHITTIEQDNRNTRPPLGRVTRGTKVVLKKEEMTHASLKLWCSLTDPSIFKIYQSTFLSIFM